MKHLVDKTEKMVRERMSGMEGSHDYEHIDRVRKMALFLAAREGGDPFIVEMAALLHDLEDWKYSGDGKEKGITREWLRRVGLSEDLAMKITRAIQEVSYKGAGVPTPCSSIEGCVVQDADRLDAMGAIGIARAFAYGGSKGRPLYEPQETPELHSTFESYKANKGSTLNHFHEKLLLLKDRINTAAALEIAEERHRFMLEFIEKFNQEREL
ncbi:MAG: HD domain-containing protein [Bacteroidota bacterium]